MKRIIWFFLSAVCLLSGDLFAQTIIPNYEKVSGNWTKNASPYIIEGEAIVPEGQVLTLEPGTVVRFMTGYNSDYSESGFDVGMLRVRGVLEALGTPEDMITFTREGEEGNWGVIFLENESEPSELAYCTISYSKWVKNIVLDDNATAAVTFFRSVGTVRNSVIQHSWAGVNAKRGAKPNCYHNVFVKNKYGIESNSRSLPEVYNSIFWNNDDAFFLTDGGSVKLSHSLISDPEIESEVQNGGKNIFDKNPRFMNPLREDYHLAPGSPCIRKGQGGVDMGAFPDEHTSRIANRKDDDDKKKKKKGKSRADKLAGLNQRIIPTGSSEAADIPEASYHALLIGVKKYDDRNISKRPRSVQYMRKLRSILAHQYGFEDGNITVLENPGRESILREIMILQDKLEPADHLLLCYSGQFEWDGSTQSGFWLAKDANIQHTNTWISHERLQSLLAFLPNKHTLLLTDTPFGGIQGLGRGGNEEVSLKELQVRRSRQVIAGDPGQDRSSKDQPWMETLLQTLSLNQTKYLSGELLLTRLTVASRNAPVHGGIIQATGDEGGEFVLKKKTN